MKPQEEMKGDGRQREIERERDVGTTGKSFEGREAN